MAFSFANQADSAAVAAAGTASDPAREDSPASTWDRQRTTLEADNADLDSSIEAFCARTGLACEPIDDRGAESLGRFPGVQDEELRRVMARNESLQHELEALQQRWRSDPRTDVGADQLLLELHIRMTVRAEGRDDSG